MNILITGSRSIKMKEYIYYILDKEINDGDYVIQGGAEGVDQIALDWCNKVLDSNSKNVNFNTVRPINNSTVYYLHRNAEMVGMCDRVIAFWDGKSRGTDFTIRYAKARNIPVKIYNPHSQTKEANKNEWR